MAVAREVYRELVGRFEGRPDGGDAEDWEIMAEIYEAALGQSSGVLHVHVAGLVNAVLKAARKVPGVAPV